MSNAKVIFPDIYSKLIPTKPVTSNFKPVFEMLFKLKSSFIYKLQKWKKDLLLKREKTIWFKFIKMFYNYLKVRLKGN